MEWTRKEVEYAKSENKKIVFVKIDKVPLSKYYRFQFGGHDIIDILDRDQKRKLMFNLQNWVKKDDILLESKSLCDDNYEIVQNKSDKTHRISIEVKTLRDFVKKLKHICNRLKIFLFAFFEWFIHLRSWVIMTTTLNILFSLLLWLGASVVEEDDDMSDVMIFFMIE